MKERFYPNMYKKNIYEINYKKLQEKNIKCLLFDLDNTCVPFEDNCPTEELKELFSKLTDMGFKVIIFSNSPEKRLANFSSLGVDYNSASFKPFSYNFIKILEKYKFKRKEVCIIGDQLLTDILGGNLIGIYTCLVDPISPNELTIVKISRKIEDKIAKSFTKRKKLEKGKYYD